MANELFYTRIQLKYDSWTNWESKKNTFKPLAGEVCLVQIPEGTSSGMQNTPPSVLMKVGNGNDFFGDLPWMSGLAADVHAWAKKSEAEFKEWLDKTAKFATDDELASVSSAVEALDEKVKGIDTRLGTAEGKIENLEKVDQSHGERLTSLEDAIGSGSTAGSLSGRVSTLEQTMQTEQGYIDTLQSEMAVVKGDDTTDGSIAKALKDAKAYADSQDTAQTTVLKAYADKAEEDAVAAAKTYTDTEIGKIDAAYKAADEAINAKVTTLIGEDANKSVREIANAELAAQLLSGKADADFKTLQELASWLEDHPEDAAAMNAAIQHIEDSVFEVTTTDDGRVLGADKVAANKQAIANEKSRAEGKEQELLGLINDLKGTGTGSVSEQITSAITEARTEWEQDIADANTEQDKVLKKYADDKVADEKSARESAVAGVQNQVKTLVGSENGTLVAGSVVASAIATAKQEAIDAAATDATTKASTAKSEAIAAAKTETTTQVGNLKSSLEAADADIKGRLDVLEEKVDITKGTVDARISAALTTAAGDATTKANAAETNAKAYADGLKTTIGQEQKAVTDDLDSRLDVIEGEGVGSIKKAVADEATLRSNADTALGNRITALETAVDAEKGTVDARIAAAVKTETDNRISDTDAIKERLTTIEGSGEGSIKKAVADEATLRTNADTALSDRITANENKLAGISETTVAAHVAAAVKAETDNRTSSETAIKNRLTTIEGTGEGSIKKAVSDEATLRANADTQIRTDFASADAETLSSAKTYTDNQVKTVADNLATLDSEVAAIDKRPFVAITENTAENYVIFNCGNAVDKCI